MLLPPSAPAPPAHPAAPSSAALWDMSLAAAPAPALQLVAGVQVAAYLLTMLAIIPAAISRLPVQAAQ